MAPKEAKAPKKVAKEAKKEGEQTKKDAEKEDKAPEEAKEEPPAKEAEASEAKPEEPAKPAKPEPPKEPEEDAVADKRKKLSAGATKIDVADTTMNVIPAADGKLLTSLSDDGLHFLLAGARSTVGMKSGRYMFEAKVMEMLNPTDSGKAKVPKSLLRVGFSLKGSSLFQGDSADSVCFDSDGYCWKDQKKEKAGKRFNRGCVIALVLNMEKAVVSLFVDGVRASAPVPLPSNLTGKALFPTVTYRNVTLQVNFGPSPLAPLPFKCHMLSAAAAEDCEVAPVRTSDTMEICFPVGLPNQGVVDWADDFLAKNPSYTELSDRMVQEWALKSGLYRQQGLRKGGSRDKPDMNFGVSGLDDFSAGRLLKAVAPVMKRNYLLLEIRSNGVAADRKATLAKFAGYKKTAAVIMGEPNAAHKAAVQKLLLTAKEKVQEEARKKKLAELQRKRALEKKLETAKRQRAEAGKKEGAAEPAAEEEEKPVELEAAEPVELSAEEKKLWYIPSDVPDVAPDVLSKTFSNFSIPEESEGFDEVKFLWQPLDKCTEHLKVWGLERKLAGKVDNIQPGEWFKEQWKAWGTSLSKWKQLQIQWKDPKQRKALVEKRKKEKAAEGGEEAKAEETKAEEPPQIDAEDLNPMDVEDICDIGSGEPLFFNFQFEDWALLSLRYELFLLVHAFKKDVNDPERPSFPEGHLGFYYQKYIKKGFTPRQFGCDTVKATVELVKDAISVSPSGIVESSIPDDTKVEEFVKFTEDHRRDRRRRIDAGDETAELKFSRTPVPTAGRPTPPAGRPTMPVGKGPLGKGAVPVGKGLPRPAGVAPAAMAPGQKRPYPVGPAAPAWPPSKQPRSSFTPYPAGGGYYRR